MNLLMPILRTATTCIAAASFAYQPKPSHPRFISRFYSSTSLFLLNPSAFTHQQKQRCTQSSSFNPKINIKSSIPTCRKYPFTTVIKASTSAINDRKKLKDLQGKNHIENNAQPSSNKFTLSNEYLSGKVTKLRSILGYGNYDVSLYIISTEEMIEINNDSRGINKSTDILSFPLNEVEEPGVLVEPPFPIEEMYNLGDMFICWDYVCDCMEQDKEDVMDDDEMERGVSGIMSQMIDNPEDRIIPLLIHGMLHLVGYDHEDDEDWELMVQKEEEIWELMKNDL